MLSLWLLGGDFAFSFFEAVFGRFLPIYLKDLQASNTLIGVMTGSFAGLVNVLFLPGISRWSDNFRGPRGRRIPFLMVVTPIVACALILVGFAPEIGGWIFARCSALLPASVTKGAFVLGLLSLLVVSYHFFNMILVNAYNWLIRDVVPLAVMARFLASFRFVATVSTIFFLWFVFPNLLQHRREIFLAIGLFYAVAFLIMCLRVKEGEYPPPSNHRSGLLRTFAVYFRECLQVPLYRYFLLVYLLGAVSLNCAGHFITLFAREGLKLDMGRLGHIFSWTAVVTALVAFPVGWLCDRFSAVRIMLGAVIVICVGSVCAYLAVDSQGSYLVYSLLFAVPQLGWHLGGTATAMSLFPPGKFGQFSGAMNVFSCGGYIIGNALMGMIMDFFHSDYHIAFLWTATFSAAAIMLMILVVRHWKRHGGPDNYVAPLPI